MTVRVLMADDHSIVRAGLATIVNALARLLASFARHAPAAPVQPWSRSPNGSKQCS